jgi:hypothetical protein
MGVLDHLCFHVPRAFLSFLLLLSFCPPFLFLTRAGPAQGHHPQREAPLPKSRGALGAFPSLFGPIFRIFGATGEASKKHVFLRSGKTRQIRESIDPWAVLARLLTNFDGFWEPFWHRFFMIFVNG